MKIERFAGHNEARGAFFMAGCKTNPLGALAMYLGNTQYRIHGTNQPSTIGSFVSSGCIRLTKRGCRRPLQSCGYRDDRSCTAGSEYGGIAIAAEALKDAMAAATG